MAKVKSKLTLGDELMFPSEYLCAEDFKGKDVTLTIASIGKQDLQMRGGGKKRKPVISFKETPRKLVCNVTNGDSIGTMYGYKADAWIGKRVTFYPTTTTCGRDTVTCIRVRERIPAEPGAKPAAVAAPTADPAPEPVPPPADSGDADAFAAEMADALDGAPKQ